MVTTKRKVEMPAGIRNKLMAAVAMLLVATILMVSSTYAWFTLSTAPEVTGISTSVGANGNLEIALLTTETFADPATITSSVGDSYVSAGKSAVTANVTWGNLVDLRDASYGLNGIKLMPAAANITGGVLAVESPLKTPTYGPDGRVDTLMDNGVSAIKSAATGAFTYAAGAQTYGVRAVGVANNISPRQLTFNAAKSAVTGAASKAARQLVTPVQAGQATLLAVAISGSAPDTYSAAQVSELLAMVKGAQSALNTIVLAYGNAGLAYAASGAGTASDEQVATLKGLITSDAATMKTRLDNAYVTTYDTELIDLAAQQTAVAAAIATLDSYKTSGTSNAVPEGGEKTDTQLVNEAFGSLYETKEFYKNVVGENTLTFTESASELMSAGGKAYISGGIFTSIASYIGNQDLFTAVNVTAVAGSSANATATPALNGVVTAVAGLTPPAGAATSTISDTYGYIIDFAFRTNAADSYLQLQTQAVNRVYSTGETSDATQGSGSNVSFTYEDLSVAQAATLLEHTKLVFFDPDSGTVYADAILKDVVASGGTATADIALGTRTISGDTSIEVLKANANIVALNQNEIKFVSVLVYLDGETITNADVANAFSSGTLALNLQFSSSAPLNPMENTALRNLTVSDAGSGEEPAAEPVGG